MMMKNSFKKYQNYIVYGGFILVFLLLIILATHNQVDRALAGGGWNSTQIAIPFGGGGVAWYAVFIMTGLLFGGILAYLEFKRAQIDTNILWDGLLYAIPLAILGTRLWYVASDILKSVGEGRFSQNQFIVNPLLILGITNDGVQLAGLAIHGAIVTVVIFVYFFAKRKKISYWFVLDVVGPGFLIGQSMGRWGNFINRELKGPAIDSLSWLPRFISDRMDFGAGENGVNLIPQDAVYHHPVFLYESSWNILGLIIILVLRHKKIFKLGDIIAFYLVWYGIGRIPNEILRIMESTLGGEPLAVGGVSISILTSAALIVGGVLVFVLKRVYAKDLGYYVDYGKKAILFDLDGTLLDTHEMVSTNVQLTFKKFLPKVKLTDGDLNKFFGPTLEQSFSPYEKDPKKIKEMIKYFREQNVTGHEKGVKPFNNADIVLSTLKERGYLIGVVSSKTRHFVELGLEQNDLLKYVDVVIGHDDVINHKPNAEPVLKALEKLAVSKDKACYVGDHPNDIISAKSAGVVSIGVSHSVHYEDLLIEKPDYIIDDLDKMLEIY